MNKGMQRLFSGLTGLVILALLWSTVTPLVGLAQATAPAADPLIDAEPAITTTAEGVAAVAATAAAADCSASPFGGLLLVGAEREIFVSYRGGTAPHQGELMAVRLDLNEAGKFQPQSTWMGKTTDAAFGAVVDPAATVADLNADGKFELIQALRDANGQFRLAAQSNPLGADSWQGSAPTHQGFATAAGNLSRTAPGDQEVVVVSRSAVDSLNVQLINGSSDGGLAASDLGPLGLWRSTENFRLAPDLLTVASGDLDGDGFDDEIVVALREETGSFIQLIVLEYTPNHQQGGGSNYENNLIDLAFLRVEVSKVRNLQVEAADIDGDYRDEIVLAYDQGNDDNDGYSNKIAVRTYDFAITEAATVITQYGQWENPNVLTPNLALATADSDGDGVAEVILAYLEANHGLTITSLDAEVATIVPHNRWQDKLDGRDQARSLDVAAADLDRDGLAEIVAGFQDGSNGLQLVRINDLITATVPITQALVPTGTYGMTLVDRWRDGAEGRTNATNITVALGDWDNDSLKAQYAPALGGTLKCKQVIEPQVTSAIFVPPFWQQIQGDQYIFASVGKTESKEKSAETALSSFYSHSASGYFGVGVGVEGTIFSFEASVKATAGYEYSATETRTGSQNQGQSVAVGWTNFNDFLVVDDSTYDCYSYQLVQNNTPVDGTARFCEHKGLKNRSLSLDAWDMREDIDLQWAPVARDWSSLTLLRDHKATQSSLGGTVANSGPALAADSHTNGTVANGSVMQTENEAAPWWQIDLGSVQEISKIRVWNRDNVGCTIASCMNQLTDFHVFISDSDPGTISNDPNVLKAAPGIIPLFHAGVGSRVTTFRTLDSNFKPIQGRYVRVQLAGTGVLALAEVQIFGPNHVEPDRYPVNVTDPDGKTDSRGNYVPGKDGWFYVQLYNPETGQLELVRTRGNLIWNGTSVLTNQQIGDGDSTLTWSLGTTTGSSSSTTTATSNTAKVGAEFDVEAGIIPVKVQTGGSYEYGTGFGREETQIISWESGFELDGGVQGFPRLVDEQIVQWPAQCRYGFQPYYYELSDESNVGYAHKFLVLDYIVPEHLLTRNGTSLEPCRAGTYKTGNNRAPQVNPLTTLPLTGASLLIDVATIAQDPDNDALTVTAVGGATHGTVTIVGNQILYTPEAGYVGQDRFTYTVSDGFGGEATGTVTIVVGGSAGQTNLLYLPLLMR